MKALPFFKSLFWLLFLNFLVKPIWIFFIDRQVQNRVGYEEYGKYFAILNLSYVLWILTDCGITHMLNQRIANKGAANSMQFLKIKFLLLLVYVAFVYFIGWITQIRQWNILFYVVLIQCFTSLYIFLRSIVTANQYFNVDAWLSVLDKLLIIGLCAPFIYWSLLFGNITLLLFLKIQFVCTATVVALAFLFLLKRELLTASGKEDMFSIIKSVAPFALIVLLMSIHYRLDGFLLERININGAFETGVYASAYRLLDAGSMVGYLAASFLVPFITRHQFDKKAIADVVITMRHVLLFFGIGAASFSVMFAPWLQRLLYHSDSAYNAQVMQFCLAALPAYLLMHVYGSVLTATAKFKPLITILAASVFINIVLNVLLIPSYGALGCCIAALASQYFCGTVSYVVATKSLGLTFTGRSNIIYLVIAIALCSFFYFAKMTIINVWLILVLAVCILVIFLSTQIKHLKKYFISLN